MFFFSLPTALPHNLIIYGVCSDRLCTVTTKHFDDCKIRVRFFHTHNFNWIICELLEGETTPESHVTRPRKSKNHPEKPLKSQSNLKIITKAQNLKVRFQIFVPFHSTQKRNCFVIFIK